MSVDAYTHVSSAHVSIDPESGPVLAALVRVEADRGIKEIRVGVILEGADAATSMNILLLEPHEALLISRALELAAAVSR